MRNVVTYHFMSIDGVAEEPSDWVFDVDPPVLDHLTAVIAKQDAVLLGSATYDYWAGHWPTSDMEPFAGFINPTPKYVFSSKPRPLAWESSVLVDTPAVDFVRELKTQPGGDIGVHGSIALSQSLLRAGLVDEIQLLIAPTIAGSGRRLFEDDIELRRMELIRATSTPAGIVLAGYRPAAS